MLKTAAALIVAALAVSACASGHGGTAGAPMPGTVPSTRADLAIARVQSVEGGGFGLFRIFPQAEIRRGCQIPEGLRPLRGTCQTRVDFRKATRVAVVTFTEYWPAARFRTHASKRGTLHHSWSFEIRRNGRVVSGGSSGDLPPQASE